MPDLLFMGRVYMRRPADDRNKSVLLASRTDKQDMEK